MLYHTTPETSKTSFLLKINEVKTMYMVSSKNLRERMRLNVTVNLYKFEVVKYFEYVGALITNDNQNENDVSARIMSATKVFYTQGETKLSPIKWQSALS